MNRDARDVHEHRGPRPDWLGDVEHTHDASFLEADDLLDEVRQIVDAELEQHVTRQGLDHVPDRSTRVVRNRTAHAADDLVGVSADDRDREHAVTVRGSSRAARRTGPRRRSRRDAPRSPSFEPGGGRRPPHRFSRSSSEHHRRTTEGRSGRDRAARIGTRRAGCPHRRRVRTPSAGRWRHRGTRSSRRPTTSAAGRRRRPTAIAPASARSRATARCTLSMAVRISASRSLTSLGATPVDLDQRPRLDRTVSSSRHRRSRGDRHGARATSDARADGCPSSLRSSTIRTESTRKGTSSVTNMITDRSDSQPSRSSSGDSTSTSVSPRWRTRPRWRWATAAAYGEFQPATAGVVVGHLAEVLADERGEERVVAVDARRPSPAVGR